MEERKLRMIETLDKYQASIDRMEMNSFKESKKKRRKCKKSNPDPLISDNLAKAIVLAFTSQLGN